MAGGTVKKRIRAVSPPEFLDVSDFFSCFAGPKKIQQHPVRPLIFANYLRVARFRVGNQ